MCFVFIILTISLTCEEDRYASCLTRITKVDSTPSVDSYDYGWVLNVSNSGLFVAMSLSHIMNWLKSTPLNCEDYNDQKSTMNLAQVGYPGWNLFSILDCGYVLMLGLLHFYGSVCILYWEIGRLDKLVMLCSWFLNCILLCIGFSVLSWLIHNYSVIKVKLCSWMCDVISVFVWIVISNVSNWCAWFSVAPLGEQPGSGI